MPGFDAIIIGTGQAGPSLVDIAACKRPPLLLFSSKSPPRNDGHCFKNLSTTPVKSGGPGQATEPRSLRIPACARERRGKILISPG